jgi:hypothetical protein
MNDDPDCHQTWPLPLLKKSVKNRKLLKKLDSSLKPFGQMNRNLVGSIYGKRRRFLEIDQLETRIACGSHICYWIGTK